MIKEYINEKVDKLLSDPDLSKITEEAKESLRRTLYMGARFGIEAIIINLNKEWEDLANDTDLVDERHTS